MSAATGSAGPAFVMPMKAVLSAERPADPDWVFERKLDGIRCLAVEDSGTTRLYSRSELSLVAQIAFMERTPTARCMPPSSACGSTRRPSRSSAKRCPWQR